MATKFYNIEKAAEVLGVTHAEINAMRERQQLHGYRDGADWKFKAEEVDQLARQSGDAASEQDVLLSEIEFGESDPGASGTVIGPPPSREPAKKDAVDSAVSGFEELDLSLADSKLDMAVDSSANLGSSIDLTGEKLDDDDLVLGGSGSGSDITLGGDSGISLIDPTDSGLSLEEPLDLTGGSHESLELGEGEDDLLSLAEASNIGLAAAAGDGDDFMLTPMDDGTGQDDDESGSQVIALEPEESAGELEMAPMLDGDVGGPLGAATLAAVGPAAAPMGVVTDFGAAAQPQAGAMALPEAPYSTWNIVSLSVCAVLLVIVGMFMYDLTRNMWSWEQATPVTSLLMDSILRRP
ncbi:MAG: helix-turn-helix domain-containing protein [Planctomycetia bacterium]|jgi:hypothetical protein|nr:helix-turn-helix domain-containing protein [Planctomycetia bacterium]